MKEGDDMKGKDNFFKNNPLVISMVYLFLLITIPIVLKWRILNNANSGISNKNDISDYMFKVPLDLIYIPLIAFGILTLYSIQGKKIWIHKKGTIKWAIKQTKIWWV